jgi:two-component system response regulator AtoC
MRSPSSLDVLLVDDDAVVRESIAEGLGRAGYAVTEAEDGEKAASLLTERAFDVAVCDVKLPKMDGLALLDLLRREAPDTVVVVMTAFEDVPDAVRSIRHGAFDYVPKPFDVDAFARDVLAPVARRKALRAELAAARGGFVARVAGGLFIAESKAMRTVGRHVELLAQSDVPVLFTGDAGVGKELAARALHALGPRREGPLVVVSCKDDSPAPSEWLAAASGGTLVLDEVEALGAPAQARLLHAVERPENRARRDESWTPWGARLVSLARDDLTAATLRGAFSEALLMRLAPLSVRIPTLAERSADFAPLVQELLRELTPPGSVPPGISPSAWQELSTRPFPGNVRELAVTLERALLLSDGAEIDLPHLPDMHRARAG